MVAPAAAMEIVKKIDDGGNDDGKWSF